jgi:hypothetical protein
VPSSSGLQTIARVALVAGAAGSITLMTRAAARQRSVVLILLFAGWVLSPFLGLALGNIRARRWPPATRTALSGAMISVSFISLSVYVLQAKFPEMKAGFIYLVVPGACWLLIAMALATAALVSPRRQ